MSCILTYIKTDKEIYEETDQERKGYTHTHTHTHTHTYIYTYTYICGTGILMVIVIINVCSDSSSKPWSGCFHFTSHQ